MRPLFLPLLLALLATSAFAQNGLTGQYYDTATFGTLKTTRTDATVNFDWGTAIPAGTAITNADTFSVAWAGQIEPEFSQLYTFYVTADDGARLWVNDQLVVARTFYATPTEIRGQVALKAGQRVNIRLEYIEQTGSAAVKLKWSSASRAREVIPTARLFPARVDKAGGALLKEHWSGIAGGTIATLTGNANYPGKPGGREFITSFECLAQDWSDSYGTRVTGYIVPPVTGSYTFAVSGDDVAELYLSTDATTANKALIASVTAATGFRVWNAQAGQQSTARTLVEGQRYYVELLHKENTGADHWSVSWMKPGDAAFSVVPGSALVQPGLTTAQPAETALFNTMAQEHPRIFATAERFARLRAQWQSAPTSLPKTWAQNAITSANTILTQVPVAYTQDVRGTILDQSRTVKDRMYKLGVAWQLTGDSQYAERAWTELSTVAAFPDWHPAHFLDTAEMTHACAIGYDWFYQYWTQPRRDIIRTAIINFVLDALGKRWFHDLGSDDYALPGYFSSTSSSTGTDRWDYYRMRPEGQNTLTINPGANADMVLGAVAPLVTYQSAPGGSSSFAIHDLTSVYSEMTRVWRGARLLGTRAEVLVQDEIQSATGKTVWWFAHFTSPTTTVAIDPDGTSAMMTQGAERLWCKIVSGGGTFQIMDAVPLPTSPNPTGQNANTGHKKLAIQLTNVTNTTLAVWFVPLAAGAAVPAMLPAITALNTWNLAATNDAPIASNGGATGSGESAVDIDLRGYVTDDTTLRFDRTGTLVVPNSIGGTGSVYIDCPIGAGTIVLSGTNSFDGGVTVNSGALRITNSTALGDGAKTITLSNGTAGNPQLRLDGSSDPIELPVGFSFLTSNDSSGAIISETGDNSIAGNITLAGGGGATRIYVSTGTLTLSGNIAPNTTGRALRLGGAGTGLAAGNIGNGNAMNVLSDLNKIDGGAWTLAGANTHTGTTTISAGTLLLGSPLALAHGGANLGNNIGGTSIIAGATLELNGQTGINEVITIRGTGVGGFGALVNNAGAAASIAGGGVSSVGVTAGGIHNTVPTVTFSGPGTGAAATAALGVTAASFTIAGGTTAYSAAPTVTGGGTGYTSAPTIAFSGGTVTTAGTNPTGTGNATSFTVSGLTVNAPGTGYTTVPIVAYSSGSGTTATAYLSSVIMGATTTIGGSADITIHPGISGNFALTQTGANTLTLAGTNTYNSPTSITGGTLRVSGSLGSSVTIASNATLHNAGTITAPVIVQAGGIYIGGGTLQGNLTNAGLVTLHGGTFIVNGSVTNTGTIRLTGGAILAVTGTFTNNGTLDIMTANQMLPAGFTNNGLVLNSSKVRVTLTVKSGADFTVTITGYAGHTYQLERADSLIAPIWTSIGTAQAGTGSALTFTDAGGATGAQRLYRVVLSP